MRKMILIALALVVSDSFVVLVPVIPLGWPSGTYQSSYQYDCPPGENRVQGLPLPYTMSISYDVSKIGLIYDQQLNPALAFEVGSTIHLPCQSK